MKPVMIHADGTDCGHRGAVQATVDDAGGPRCPAGIPVTRIRVNGQVMTVEEATEAFRQLGAAFVEALRPLADATASFGQAVRQWAERNRPAFDQLAEAAQRVREARERGEVPPPPGRCYCLCAKTHPGDRGVCDGEAVTARHYDTVLLGPVDVALCAPCAAAQFLAEVTG